MSVREYVQIALLAVLVAGAATGGFLLAFRRRRDPQERERIRRLSVNARGRLADGYILEASADTVYYSYSVRGVAYTASQDVSAIREFIPGQADRLIGPVTLKYLAANPANSIIVCEEWTGLRPGPEHPIEGLTA